GNGRFCDSTVEPRRSAPEHTDQVALWCGLSWPVSFPGKSYLANWPTALSLASLLPFLAGLARRKLGYLDVGENGLRWRLQRLQKDTIGLKVTLFLGNQSGLKGKANQAWDIINTETFHELGAVVLDGFWTQVKNKSNCFCGLALGDELKDLTLPLA